MFRWFGYIRREDADAHAAMRAEHVRALKQIELLESATLTYARAITERDTLIASLRDEVRTLIEIRTTAQVKLASALAHVDLWRVQINQLQEERAMLLARALPGTELHVPKIGAFAGGDPGLSFHDMGDVDATHLGLATELPTGPTPARPLDAGEPLLASAGGDMFKDAEEE